jgi:hypothetical protein
MRSTSVITCALALAAGAAASHAAMITPGNLVVYRVGTGANALANTGNEVFLDEYTRGGNLVQSIPLNASAPGTKLIASGTATSEGLLTVSPDYRFVTATGYNTTVGTSGLTTTAGSAVGRSVAVVTAATGAAAYGSFSDFSSANNPRSAITDDGARVWLAGAAGGIRLANLSDPTSTQILSTPANFRQLEIFDGQLYASTNSGSALRLGAIGSGLPTSSVPAATPLPGLPISTGSPYSFFLADLSSTVAGPDTLYVADDANGGGILKYSLVGGSWTASGSIAGTSTDAYRGLTGYYDPATGAVSLFGTRKGGSGATGGGELFALTDTSGYNATINGSVTVLATASANTAFRGVVIVPAPGAAALMAGAGLIALRRRR